MYLEDVELAKATVEGTCDIPTDPNKATKCILQEIGKWARE